MRAAYWKAVAALAGALSLSVAVQTAPQAPAEQKPAPTVKRVTAQPISSVQGKDSFESYCAVCHDWNHTNWRIGELDLVRQCRR